MPIARIRSQALVVAKGFCMGAADVVPGVSGGTMAFILGIYQRLLEAIRSFDVTFLRLVLRGEILPAIRHADILFLAFLAAGILGAILFFTRVIPLPQLIVSHPELVYGLFFGLIVASVGVLLAELEDWSPRDLVPFAAGIAGGLAVANLVPVDTPNAAWFVFLAGALAITAMILPGLSGSFILLVLHKYAYVFDAIGHFRLEVLVPFALGAATGLLAFSRLLVWLLHHHYRSTLLAISGILVGSLWMVWPFQHRVYEVVREKSRLVSTAPVLPDPAEATTWASLGLVLAGVLVVVAIHRLARTHPTPH